MLSVCAERCICRAHALKVVGAGPSHNQFLIIKIFMLSKIEILVVIYVLLLTFYFVISWGASKKGKSPQSPKVSNYLFNVRILIIIIGVVSSILWFFL